MNPPALEFSVTKVEDSVGYLLARARTMISRGVDESLRELDITHAQSSIFMMLWMGKCRTAAELSRDLFIDSAAMKRTIDKLVAKGLLERIADLDDKRLYALQLTPSGHAIAQQLPAIYREVLDISFTGFQQEEIEFLKFLLRKLLANRPILEAHSNTCHDNQ
ncbi:MULTISPECIES: MarR family transcriptional regulator [unclassified Undibacterium]|uniref:MarR family winged helix-turn-helix transcriptional regulator n=1 Tax=unclassified Undibacterium TaxID=2630295 RepID=UPI002AC909C5|nr:MULTISPECIES: MarR family transcriptional regulator [unclassified Undibacterium]MEB0139660.1 MarR family transcriptional regulator [Undibacterium sp. CCC2.1]MEB0172541.1 MarR family transcriptional regulator [Undibacterium sp. CCC1.1]MEB0176363.1 MarR family transcriptional regulator [Undibacterium sp. CCC3.4]MEB0215697.1 MarR family transcriptional regulator [Undibacterium sp. 5I2]WPX42974.1 MarR family transcriptional regulator [Undibacterium sp. CCC3.4]